MNKLNWDYVNEVEIDQHALDISWKEQPGLVLKYGEARVEAVHEVNLAKEDLKLLEAQKDSEIRNSYSDGKKPTETAIASAVLLDSEVQDARKVLINAEHNLGLLQAACSAFDNRRSALENLVKLFGMNYFAEPAADIEARGKLGEMSREGSKEKVRKALAGMSGKIEEDIPAPVRRRK